MADVTVSGTAVIISDMRAAMGYFWCSTEAIQKYLDRESLIDIGDGAADTFPTVDAEKLENAVVYEVSEYLNKVFILPLLPSRPTLVETVAKLTAAQIGLARMGASMGNDITPWTERYKNEGWAHLRRLFINQSLSGVENRSVSLWKRLLMSKTRERSIVPNA